jgi:hypothetical protein
MYFAFSVYDTVQSCRCVSKFRRTRPPPNTDAFLRSDGKFTRTYYANILLPQRQKSHLERVQSVFFHIVGVYQPTRCYNTEDHIAAETSHFALVRRHVHGSIEFLVFKYGLVVKFCCDSSITRIF